MSIANVFTGLGRFLWGIVRCLTIGGIARLTLLCALGYGLWRLMTSPLLAIQTLEIRGPVEALGLQEVTQEASENVRGNIITVDIQAVKQAVKNITWVKDVEVTRLWPNSLYINVVGHKAIAIWDDGRLVSDAGVLFSSNDEPIDNLVKMPTFGGDPQYVSEMVRMYPLFQEEVKKINARIKAVNVTFRGSWSVTIDSENFEALTIELGRALVSNGPVMRLVQVMDNFDRICKMMHGWPAKIDARYRNAFAAKLPDGEGVKRWKLAQAKKKTQKVESAQSKAKDALPPAASSTQKKTVPMPQSPQATVTYGTEIDLSGTNF